MNFCGLFLGAIFFRWNWLGAMENPQALWHVLLLFVTAGVIGWCGLQLISNLLLSPPYIASRARLNLPGNGSSSTLANREPFFDKEREKKAARGRETLSF